MADTIEIAIDRERRFIRQRIAGEVSEDDARAVESLTVQEVPKLEDPSYVRILIDGRKFGFASTKARKIFSKNLKREDLGKIAFWGARGRIASTLLFFASVFSRGKMRLFSSEDKAIGWLLET
jgi:hypothetical protein